VGEEAEEMARLGLERLVGRRALALADDRITLGAHGHARDLLAYYARSLAALQRPSAQALAASVGSTP
jgi:hypothetical protein